ncbi:MAG: polysaccharide deacetylase family protein, partial [Clostridium sp.]
KATFFVNGHIGFENTYQRIVNEGHKLGNHTYSHDYGEVYSSIDSFFNSINKLNEYLSSLGIGGADIVRFPGGSNNTVSIQYGGADLMDKLVNQAVINGYDYFDWNVSSGDANKVTEDKDVIINNVKKGCAGKRNPVILMHDSAPKTTTADGLQEIIDYLKGQGYRFEILESGNGVPAKFK